MPVSARRLGEEEGHAVDPDPLVEGVVAERLALEVADPLSRDKLPRGLAIRNKGEVAHQKSPKDKHANHNESKGKAKLEETERRNRESEHSSETENTIGRRMFSNQAVLEEPV